MIISSSSSSMIIIISSSSSSGSIIITIIIIITISYRCMYIVAPAPACAGNFLNYTRTPSNTQSSNIRIIPNELYTYTI